jgi:hypothetical protein
VAGTELRLGMSPDYPIAGDHPLVPVLRASFDAARDFGLTDAELWCVVQEVLSDADRNPADLPQYVGQLHDELAQAILAKEYPHKEHPGKEHPVFSI